MGFKSFLLTEGRSQPLETDKAVDLYKKKCKNYRWDDQLLYRGIKGSSLVPLYIDPKKHERKSRNTDNYYTLWTDNSKKWSTYPKRSESIICTSYRGYTLRYGQTYRVIPLDGATIGICPTEDWWNSFGKFLFDMPNVKGMYDFINELTLIVSNILDKPKEPLRDRMNESYESLLGILKEADAELKRKGQDARSLILEWYDVLEKYGGVVNMMDTVFDPTPNKFKAMPFDKYTISNFPSNEIWTDSPSLLITALSDLERDFREMVGE